jgi:hypothetical protein
VDSVAVAVIRLMVFGSVTFKGRLGRILHELRQFETVPVFDSTFFSNMSNGSRGI